MSTNRLPLEFYSAPATELAPKLLGKLLCCRRDGLVLKARITETECYYGESDTACHAHKGRTKRTETLYHAGGVSYIYLCYGIHELLNVVTGPEGHPEAVLLRGVEGYEGPGKLTKYLGIDRRLNAADLTGSDALWLEDDGTEFACEALPRVGIGYASEEDQARLWRFRRKE